MTLKLMKGLTATTAFVAAAASAQAATYVSGSTTINTADDTGPYVISSSESVSVTSGPAFIISGTSPTSNTLTINTSGTAESDGDVIRVVEAATSATSDTTINVSGSIISTGTNGKAISATGVANAVNLNVYSTGVVSGSINLGAGADIVSSTGGTFTGDLTTADGADTVYLKDSQFTGNIVTGNNDDNVTVIGGRVSGTIHVDAGNNTVLVSDSRVYGIGSSSTASGNSFTVNNSTVDNSISVYGGTTNISSSTVGSFGGGSGSTDLNVQSTTFSGLVDADLGGAGGTDTVNFVAGTNTLNGDFKGFDAVNVQAGTLNINSTTTSLGAMTVSAGATTNIGANSTSTGISGVFTNNGTLNLNNAGTFNAASGSFGANSVLGITVSDSTHASKLALADNSTTGATSVTVALGSNAGYIANGTSYTIISTSGGNVATPTMVTSNPLYTFQVAQTTGNDNISLTLVRRATSSLVESSAGKSVANALDSIGNTVSGDVHTIQSNITAATSAGQINTIVESLTPATDAGAVQVTANVGQSAGNNVTTRLASLRSGSALSGVATGSGMYQKNMWVQGFGNTTSQDNKDGNAGYDASTGGATFGMDTDSLVDGFTTGAAVTYARSNVDSNASNDAQSDVDSYLVTLYGSRVLDNGYFLNGQAGAGFNQYDTERQVSGFSGKTTADFDGMQYTAKLEGGRDIALNPCMTLTPLAGVQYTHLDVDGYTESGPAALNVDDASFDAVDLSAGAQLGWNLGMDNGNILRPNLRAKYIYRAGDTNVQNTSRFVAGGTSFTTEGVEADRSSLNLGAGLLLTSVRGMDLSLDYDADIRDSLTGHTGQVKVRMPF